MTEASNVNRIRDSFRGFYHTFESALQDCHTRSNEDPPLEPEQLASLGDQLDEFCRLFEEYSFVFEQSELERIRLNVSAMQTDIRLLHSQAVDGSHHGRPEIIQSVATGGRGRPSYWINPGFLQWARAMGRTTASIADYLHVSWSTVRMHLLRYGIAEPQPNPFAPTATHSGPTNIPNSSIPIPPNQVVDLDEDDLLDPQPEAPVTGTANPQSQDRPQDRHQVAEGGETHVVSYPGMLSSISDDELDDLIRLLRQHFRRAGITHLDGMLRYMGHRLPRERIRESLARIDPVQRIFQRIRIRRRTYSVAGPNALWHHDGQHGLIRWGIVIHGFIDGYSRLIVGLRASNNNRSQTVLDLFMAAVAVYAIPSRVRGDHGVENLLVAAFMEENMGQFRGSYIWGRSVHNVRIERLWVDVTAQIGATWKDHFYSLELHHGLNINNTFHIWLLHLLFLPTINAQLSFFAQSWNHHTLQIRNGPNRTPADMFGFDMIVHGVRGTRLPVPSTNATDDVSSSEELEVYGVDWEALHEDRLLQSQQQNNPTNEGFTSWVGQVGPPSNLNEVVVNPPEIPLSEEQTLNVLHSLGALIGRTDDEGVTQLWSNALALARTMNNLF